MRRGSAINEGRLSLDEGIAQWREFIEEALRQPDLLFCRVVRSQTEIVAVLCGRRNEVVSLGPMYLLNEFQGQGVGARLMGEFLARADPSPMRLWVTEYNERAIRFYERHGFQLTRERDPWLGKLPNVRMARDPMPHPKIA